MKSIRLIRFLGVLAALNLVACAHEIPLGGGELTDQEASQEEIASQATGTPQQADGVWEQTDSAQEVAANEANDDASFQADLDNVQKAVEADFAEDDQNVAAAVIEAPQAEAQAIVQAKAIVENVEAAPAKKAPLERNRYYVVRAGDTAEYVSMLLYKNPNQAAKLIVWNGPTSTWNAGKVLYYVSPQKPHDKRMLSFYEERELASDTLTVQPGDSLAALAEKHLGSSASAKEIALVNGLKDDEGLKPGQVLRMYPSPLLGKPKGEAAVAAAPVVAPAAVPAPAVVAANTPAATPTDRAVDTQAVPTVLEKSDTIKGPAIITLAPAAPADAKPKASLASTLMASLFNHHPLVLACTLCVLGLFGGFFYLRRRNGSNFDF